MSHCNRCPCVYHGENEMRIAFHEGEPWCLECGHRINRFDSDAYVLPIGTRNPYLIHLLGSKPSKGLNPGENTGVSAFPVVTPEPDLEPQKDENGCISSEPLDRTTARPEWEAMCAEPDPLEPRILSRLPGKRESRTVISDSNPGREGFGEP